MGDYSEDLKGGWIEVNEMAKKLVYIEDYAIHGSAMPNSGEFYMILVSMADLAPSKAKYEAFMAEWGKERLEEGRAIAKSHQAFGLFRRVSEA